MRIIKAFLIFSVIFTLSAGLAQAEKIVLKKDEITSALSHGKTMHGYARLSGILADLVRTVKNEASNDAAGAHQEAIQSAEDLINEAGLPASQGDYDAAFTILEQAASALIAIIDSINGVK